MDSVNDVVPLILQNLRFPSRAGLAWWALPSLTKAGGIPAASQPHSLWLHAEPSLPFGGPLSQVLWARLTKPLLPHIAGFLSLVTWTASKGLLVPFLPSHVYFSESSKYVVVNSPYLFLTSKKFCQNFKESVTTPPHLQLTDGKRCFRSWCLCTSLTAYRVTLAGGLPSLGLSVSICKMRAHSSLLKSD